MPWAPTPEEFGELLDTVRGADEIVAKHRPVPLWQHVMVGRKIVDLFAGDTKVRTDRAVGGATADEAADSEAVAGSAAVAAGSAAAITAELPGRAGFEVNPELLSMARAESQMNFRGCFGHGGRNQRQRNQRSQRDETAERPAQPGPEGQPAPGVIASLDRQDLLPAITFIFSRAGCDAAVAQCVAADSG